MHGQESIELMPADSIVVRESTNTVNVSGEVYNQGLIEFKKGKSIRYYLNRSGGITINGDKNKVVVIYPVRRLLQKNGTIIQILKMAPQYT